MAKTTQIVVSAESKPGVLAKVAVPPASSQLEQAAIFGMSFLTDNSLREELDAAGIPLSGCVWVR